MKRLPPNAETILLSLGLIIAVSCGAVPKANIPPNDVQTPTLAGTPDFRLTERAPGGDMTLVASEPSIPAETSQPRLIYAREDRSIWIWSPEESAPWQVTRAWPVDDRENTTAFLTWVASPDSRWLVYYHGTSPIHEASQVEAQFRVVGLGGDQTPLAQDIVLIDDVFAEVVLTPPVFLTPAPGSQAWSPDSSRLAVVSHHERPEGAVYVASLIERGVRRVADGPAQEISWSPDGGTIAFVRQVIDSHGVTSRQLAWVSSDGGGASQALGADYVHHYGWTLDGNLVVYADLSSEAAPGAPPRSQLLMVAPRTGAFSVLYEGFVRGADWSTERGAFAAHIYDLGSRDGLYGIYEVKTEGAVEALRTGDPLITDTPMPVLSWSPNGQSLAWGGSCCPCQLGLIGAGTVGQAELSSGCQIGNVRWSGDSRYLLVEKGRLTEPPFSGAFVVFDVETGEQIASGRIPIQGNEGNQAAWSISAAEGYVARIEPRAYEGMGLGVAIGDLRVGLVAQHGQVVDSSAATWGPALSWIGGSP